MELLEVTLTQIQRRNRAAFVRKADLSADRSLAPGEKVVLRDEAGEYFAATVIDEIGAGADAQYLMNVGVRLPEEYAVKRLQADAKPRQRDEMQDLLDLLGEARALLGNGAIPAQRWAH